MIIFVIIASLGQMVAPAIVSAMLDYISSYQIGVCRYLYSHHAGRI